MLSPWEFSVGTLANATGLMWVRSHIDRHEEFLVTDVASEKTAIFLHEHHNFDAWECSDANNHFGILVPNVQIEVDETSGFDIQRSYSPYGALVRQRDTLTIAARVRDHHQINRQHFIPLITGLPASGSDTGVGFLKWQIVVGEGHTRRVLKMFDRPPAEGPPR